MPAHPVRHRSKEAGRQARENEQRADVGATIGLNSQRFGVAQLLGLLATACALTAGCTSLQLATPGLIAEATQPEVASVGGGVGRAATPEGGLQARVQLGRSVGGVPVTMEVVGDGPESVFVVGGMHGNEPAGAAVASRLARFLRSHPELLDGRRVAILAEANPDGLRRGQRVNANGVDLNRNFPSVDWRRAAAGETAHGPFSASEPETRAVIKAIQIIKPDRIIDIHSIGGGRHGNNYDGPGERLARLMSRFNGYPVLASIGYPTPGALGNWSGIDRGIPTITLELPRGLGAGACWRDNVVALLAAIGADPDALGGQYSINADSMGYR